MDAAHLWLFFAVVFGVVVLPGMDMAYVMASALRGGARSGAAAVAGITAGGVVHVAVGATGVAVLLATAPAAFNALLVAGVLYVAWLGVQLIRSGARLQAADVATPESAPRTFGRAMLTCLLNPKAYVFMLAVFPQFIRADAGPVARQALVLGAIIAATQVGVYGTVALLSARAGGWLRARPGAQVAVARSIGVLLLGTAAFTGIEGWRGD